MIIMAGAVGSQLHTPKFRTWLPSVVNGSSFPGLSMLRRSSPLSSRGRLTTAAGRRRDRASGTGRRTVWEPRRGRGSLWVGGSGT